MNTGHKSVSRRMVAFVLSMVMALAPVVSPMGESIFPSTVNAASSKLSDKIGRGKRKASTGASGEHVQADGVRKITQPIYLKELLSEAEHEFSGEWKEVSPKKNLRYSGTLKKIYDRMSYKKDKYTSGRAAGPGNKETDSIWCADLSELYGNPSKYCAVTYKNVEIPVLDQETGLFTKKKFIDITFKYWRPVGVNDNIDDSSDPAGDEGYGPLIGAYDTKEAIGVIAWNGYSRLRNDIIITDAGSNKLTGDPILATFGIMDIDAGQSVELYPQNFDDMVVSGFLGDERTEGDDVLRYGSNTNAKWNSEFRAFLNRAGKISIDNEEAKSYPNYSVYDAHDKRFDYPETSTKGALVLDINFTPEHNNFHYWYFAGVNDDDDPESTSDGFGTQNGRVFEYLQTDEKILGKFVPPTPTIESPKVTKLVEGTDKFTLPNGGYEFEYTLTSTVSSDIYSSIKNADDDFDIEDFGFEDKLVDELEYIPGSGYVTLNGETQNNFTVAASGQTLTASLNDPLKNIKAGDYVLHFKAKIKDGSDLSKYVESSDKPGYAMIPNEGLVRFDTNQKDQKEPERQSGTVYVYWKPGVLPAPVKTVNGAPTATIEDGNKTFTYRVTQNIPADTYPYGWMSDFTITDDIDDQLVIERSGVKVVDVGGHEIPGFDITYNGNSVTATANQSLRENPTGALYGRNSLKAVTLVIPAHYFRIEDPDSYNSHRLQNFGNYSLTDGTAAAAHVDQGETRVLTQNNAQVTTKWGAWSQADGWNGTHTTGTTNTTVPIPKITAPTKTVSDADASNNESASKNTLTNADEVWTYTVEQKIPAKTAAIYRYNKFNIVDEIDPCLTIGKDVKSGENKLDDITITVGGQTMNHNSDFMIQDDDNVLTFTPSDALLQGGNNNLFYGGANLAETSVRISIPVHIYSGNNEGGSDASNQEKLEQIRKHGHFHTNDAGNEEYMTFTNKATTNIDDMLSTTPDTFETGTTSTRLDVPQLADPVKYVSDKDDYNWDHTVKQDGEVKFGEKNRISDATNQWYYTVEQDIPAHVAPLYYFKTFRYADNVDKCLEYDPDHVKVFLFGKDADINGTGTDITSWFESKRDEESNALTVTAKDGTKAAKSGEEEGGLKSDAFYGSKKGSKIVMVFPVHIKLAEDTYDTSEMKEHGHLITDDKGHQVYDFKNNDKDTLTETIIDNLVKVKNNMESEVTTAEDHRVPGKEVETQVEVPMPEIKKKADRFEWEVGEDVKYTITVNNKNPGSIMDKVTVTDKDLPDSMQLDGSREDAIMVYASGATDNHSAPGNAQTVPNPRGLLEEKKEGEIVDAVEAKGAKTNPLNPWIPSIDDEEFLENITKQCEVTYYNDQGDTGDGFKVLVPKQYRGEEVKITFLCKITEDFDNCVYRKTCVNGSIVENTADVVSTLMLYDEPQVSTERIWVNTPHLSIQKLTGSYKYVDGEFKRVDENATNYKPGDSVHYTLLVKNSHPGTIARDPVVTDKVLNNGLIINKNDIEVSMIRLNADGTPRVKDGNIGESRLVPGQDYQLTTYGQSDFEIYFTGRNLRHWGDTPFSSGLDENKINNAPYENGTKDDKKVPGLKQTDEDHYFKDRETADGETIPYRDDVAFNDGNIINEESAWLTDKSFANTWNKYPVGYQTANAEGRDTDNDWESIRSVNHPKEWEEADTAYIIEYNATLTKGITLEKAIRNDVYADSENSEFVDTHATIHFEGATLEIDKESDKGYGGEYSVGSTGHYSLKVTNTQDQVEAKNIVVKDVLGKEEAKIVRNSIKVYKFDDKSKVKFDENRKVQGGTDITDKCTYPEDANDEQNIYINTGENLTTKQAIIVTYDIDFTNETLGGKNVPNTALAKADNAYPELIESTEDVKLSDDISARKTSEPYTGVTVKQGDKITYTIDINNTSNGDLTNVLVRDFIPEHSTYVEGSAFIRNSNDPVNLIEIDGKQAVAAVIPVLHKNTGKQLIFDVTVDEDATDDDVIVNVAEVYDTKDEEIAPDTKFEKDQPFDENVTELFNSPDFVMTNQTVHPLSYWAQDDHLAHLLNNPIAASKETDKKTYFVGEDIQYKVSLINNGKDIPVPGVKLDDTMDSESAEIDPESFKIELYPANGKAKTLDVKPEVNEAKNGYHIDFGIDLNFGEKIVVTYTAKAKKTTEKLINAAVFSDNKDKEYPVEAEVQIDDASLSIVKDVRESDLYLGQKAEYVVTVKNYMDRSVVKNLTVEDTLEKAGLVDIDKDSIKVVWKTDGAEDQDITAELNEKNAITVYNTKDNEGTEEAKNGYKIETGRDLSNKDTLVITYVGTPTAAAVAYTNEHGKIVNTAAAWGDGSDKVTDTADINVADPALLVEKSVDPAAPQAMTLKDKASYKVKVTQPTDRGKIENLVVEDSLEQPGLIEIEEGSIKVTWNGEPLKNAKITLNEAKDGYKVETGETLTSKDTLEITYTGIPQRAAIDFCADAANEAHDIDNTVYVWGTSGGKETEKVHATAHTTVEEFDTNLVIKKSSDKATYSITTPEMITKGNEEVAHYTAVIKNEKDGVAENVVINDAFERKGMKIKKDSIKLYLVNKANPVSKDKPNGTDITEEVNINKEVADNAYTIETGMNLELNDYFTVTYDVIFTDASLANKDIKNIIKATDDNGDESKDDNTVKVLIPDLNIGKNSDSPKYTVGESGDYTVVVEQKEKDVTAYNVVISDKLTAPIDGFSITEGSIKVADTAGNDVTDQMAKITAGTDSYTIETGKNLNYGEKFTVTYKVAFKSPNLEGVAVTNIASVKADNAPEKTSENKIVLPNMEIWKDSNPVSGSNVNTGDTITYNINVKNTTDADIDNVMIKDAIPEGTEYVTGGEVVNVDGTDYVTFIVEKLTAGETVTESFDVKVTAEGPATINNIALVKAGNPEDGWGNDPANPDDPENPVNPWNPTNETEHYVPEPVDGITAIKSSTPVSGSKVKTPKTDEDGKYLTDEEGNMLFENDEIEYNIAVKNTTDKAIEKVAVRDMIPEYTEWISGGEIVKISEKDYATFVIDKIEAGETETVSFKVKVTANGSDGQKRVTNVAEFKVSDDPEVNWEDGTWTKTNEVFHEIPQVVEVESQPTLAIEKKSDKSTYSIGDTGHYTVTVTETTEDRIAKNIVIKDELDNKGAEIQTDTITLYDTNHEKIDAEINLNGTVGYYIETGRDLAYGEKLVVEYDVLFKSERLANKQVVNVAKAKSDNAKAVTTNEVPVPKEIEDGLYMLKTSDPITGTTVKKGENITYYIDVTADADKENVLVLDAIPDKTTYVEGSAKLAKTEKTEEEISDMSVLDRIVIAFKGLFGLNGSDDSENKEVEGRLVTINEKNYVAFNIDKITATDKYVAKFTVTVNDDVTEDDVIRNVALGKTAKDEDPDDPSTWNPDEFNPTNETEHPLSDWAIDKNVVEVTAPTLAIEKQSDKETYAIGETGHYTVKVTQTKEDEIAKNVVIKDELQIEGAKIVEGTIKLTDTKGDDVEDITNAVKITRAENGLSYQIDTGMDLAYNEEFTVTYDVLFESESLVNQQVNNIAKAKSDNAFAQTDNSVVPVEIGEDLTALKRSEPESGTIVKAGEEITYFIDITNNGSETKENIMVMDEIPQLTTFVDGSGMFGDQQAGSIVKVNDKTYFAYNIASVEAGKTETVSFKVTVSKDATEDDIIKNIALAKPAEDGDNPEDPSTWNPDNFTPTNEVEHPLGKWVKDDNTVNVTTPENPDTPPAENEPDPDGPELTIEKKADKKEYNVGDTATYTLTIKNTVEGTIAKNVKIQDSFDNKKVEIDKNSLVVKDQDGKEHKVTITNKADTYYGFSVATGLNLDGGKSMTMTYKVAFKDSSLKGKELTNTAVTSADNADEAETENTVTIKGKESDKDKDKDKDKEEKGSDNKSDPSNGNSSNVKTMDMLMRFMIIALGILAVAGIVYDRKRRKNKMTE